MNFRPQFFRTFVPIALIAIAGSVLSAQEPPQPPPQSAQPLLSPQQLDNLVAPIALYSDPLLTQVLVASTYPLEIVEAEQWMQQNRSLTGANLVSAAQQQNWDASVQALVAFPDVLARLNQNIRWTTDLGNSFLAQQADVMSAIQRMRASAESNGRLSSTPQQVVTDQTANGQTAIQIEPANPQVIYVPTYDPMYIWGPPVWGAYPPLWYPSFGFGFGPGFDVGLCFGGWGGWGGWSSWGWGPNWFGGGVIVNPVFFRHYGFHPGVWSGVGYGRSGLWTHDPIHRLGVPYPNRQLAGRFDSASRLGARQFAGRTGVQGGARSFQSAPRSTPAYGGAGRNFNGAQRPSFQSTPRSAAPSGVGRNFNGAQRPSYQAAPRSAAPAYSAPGRSFGGAQRPSFQAPPRSSGGSFGGGGHSFGGGGRRR